MRRLLVLATVFLLSGWQSAFSQDKPPTIPKPPTEEEIKANEARRAYLQALGEALKFCGRLDVVDPEDRDQIIKAIGRRANIGSWAVVLHLRACEADPKASIREATAAALKSVGLPTEPDELVGIIRGSWVAADLRYEKYREILQAAGKAPDQLLEQAAAARLEARKILGALAGPDMPSSAMRSLACIELATHFPKHANTLRTLDAALLDEATRKAAARALRMLEDGEKAALGAATGAPVAAQIPPRK